MARLDRLLAMNLGLSRREVARLLARGEIRDGSGQVLQEGRTELRDVEPVVWVHERETPLYARFSLLLHKPLGCVTALRDQLHPTAYALIQEAPLAAQLRPVGRLDLQTSGLLLWTTEGAWVHALTHPKRAVPRCYHVGLHRPFAPCPNDLELKDGHRPKIQALDRLAPQQVHPGLLQNEQTRIFATITLLGGAYHEVRRIFAALGSHVESLCRVQHGPWHLPHDLPPGQYRPIELDPSQSAS